jgi:hypothetical protein
MKWNHWPLLVPSKGWKPEEELYLRDLSFRKYSIETNWF